MAKFSVAVYSTVWGNVRHLAGGGNVEQDIYLCSGYKHYYFISRNLKLWALSV